MRSLSNIFILSVLLSAGSCKVSNKAGSVSRNPDAFSLSLRANVWQAIGPFGSPSPLAVKGEWSAHGTGRFECIEVNPENGNEILIGHATSGLFKRIDGGITWEQKLTFPFSTGIFDILRFRKDGKHLLACCARDIGLQSG